MKTNRGGQRNRAGTGAPAAAPVITPTVVTPPTPQQVASGDVLPKGGVAFSDFQGMTDDEKADVVVKALGVGLPMFLENSDLQRFAYFTGMSDKPTIVSDAQMDSIKGPDIFRGVYDAYDSKTDIGYSSKDIYDQVANGDYTRYSDSGGSVHGKAIYFGDDFGTAVSYSMYGNNPIIMRAKITSGKVIGESTITKMYQSELRQGTKLALACSRANHDSRVNLFALAKGYSATTDGGYTMVLNRGCLTMSDTTKKAQGSRW